MAKDRTQLRREEILEAAVEQFTARGIAGTRAADVAKSLGVSNGLIFYHFESKNQLIADAFAFVVDHGLQALWKIVEDDRPPLERMGRALSLYGPDEEATGWRIWLDAWSASLRNDSLRETIVRLNDAWEEAFMALVRDGVESGVFSLTDPELAVTAIIGIMDGTAVQAVVRGQTDRMRSIRRAAARAVTEVLGLTETDKALLLESMSQAK
ncbi:TetR/AcrR family transcriptional regulator [Sinomonas sp. ASV322]|uniref:TetR/AcrR family transcriptional regulator n=1 Tax=Sinomonas sp. ASV322 TaxID=3041920 RepID=UPI0027DE77F6|nr:TetR/AcrR family transcriptional regulator [Sinomonas sp. ASV322]MDQ4501069.1 TetR/AcrR family transcriptional regulator [Sinomonas sp. ASV322]